MVTRKKHTPMLRIQALILSVIMLLTFIAPSQIIHASEGIDQTGNADIVRSLSLKYMLKGTTTWNEMVSPYKIADGTKIEKFHAEYSFKLNETEDGDGLAKRTMKSGDYYLINFPDKLKVINPSNGSILGNNNKPIATYNFLQDENGKWQIKVQFTEYIDDPNEFEIQGHFQFEFSVDLSSVKDGESSEIRIPIDNKSEVIIDITKPMPPPTKPISLTKTAESYNHSTRELVWNVKMMPEIGVFSGCIFTDNIDIGNLDLKSIKHGNVTLVEGVDYTFDKDTGKLEYKIPNGRNGKSYQNITITTVAKRSIYGNTTSTIVSNRAHLSGGESFIDIDSNTAEKTITPEWLKKEGTFFEGNQILWTINANITNQLMYDGVITDKFTADVRLDKESVKLGNTKLNVYENDHTPLDDKEVYGIYRLNGDGTAELKIYLPRGKVNASNAKQTVTLITNIVSPDKKTDIEPIYNNTASLDGKYITDGDGEGTLPEINSGTIGVPIPYVYVVKGHSAITAEDKRNGTITWTISAQSNLAEYGKSQIVDTLPNDQDYIADEIYWGNQKINGTTEPRAEISEDGRKLTISFNADKALQTNQKFTIKTKIKEDIYGKNINRDFTNEASVALYSKEDDTLITEAKSTDKVRIQNTVIAKSSVMYNENNTGIGQRPRTNFNITVNSNLMPLSNVIVTDDLNKIITEFKKDSESTYKVVAGVKWTYVPNTLKIIKNSGNRDNFDLVGIVNSAKYSDNMITVNFGKDVEVNDKYTISFTAELDMSQSDIFKENGNIRCRGNIADIIAGKLNGKIESPPTGTAPEIKNQVLEKFGTHMEAEQQILWTINLNQHRITLENTRVEDILPKGLTLDPTSIKLYTKVIGKDGNFITGDAIELQGEKVEFSYEYLSATGEGMEGRYKLIVTLPNNQTDYILRFATDVDKSILGQKISNNAYYTGKSGTTESYDTSVVTLSSSAGGSSINKSSVTVNKRSKDNNENLTGSAFTLHWLKGGNEPVFVRTLTANDGKVTFRGLTRGEKYTITEVTPPSGYLLDSSEPVEFTAPAGTGDASDINFYNTPIKTGSWIPEAIKKLDGKAIMRPFHFEITDGTTTIMNGATKNKLSNGDYTVEFALEEGISDEDILSFTDDHTFNQSDVSGTEYIVATKKLYMKEVPLNLPGYGFDNNIYELLVKVVNVKGQDNLKIVIEDDKGNKLTDDSGKFLLDKIPYFQNTYRANGSIQFSAEKTLTGHELLANQFSFELYEGNTLIETIGNKVGRKVDGDIYTGNIDFTPIKYTQSDVGLKTYKILEKNTSLPGYTYDTAIYTFDVNIEDNDNGTISSTVKNIKKVVGSVTTDETKIQFNNTYKTTGVNVNLTASKVLTGRTLENEQFSFTFSQVDSEGKLIKEIGTVKNNNGSITFPELNYKQSDIGASYYYQIKEVNDSKLGYTYDSSIYTVKVDIIDNNDGTIKAVQTVTKDKEEAKEITFTNSYKASGKTQITATKSLTGKALANNQFSFAMQQIDSLSGAEIGEKVVVRNNDKGNIVFPEIEYTEVDAGKDFYYKVYEVSGGIGGYTYDTTEYTLKVTVNDNGDGTLKVQQGVVAPKDKTDIKFENVYTVLNASLSFEGTKILRGCGLEAGQFTFTLNNVTEEGTFLEKLQETKNNKDGAIKFNDVIYTQEDIGKTYYYQLLEINDKKPGYTYDSSIYNIKVEVIDNNDGTLNIVQSITKDKEEAKEITFTNNYKASGKTQITATKSLTGKALANNQFSFAMQQIDSLSGAEVGEKIVVRNDDKGTIVFPEIEYTEVDAGKDFYYNVYEINEGMSGYSYDSTLYNVKVTVIDNADGTLKTQQEVVGLKDKTDIKFENVYTVSNDSLSIEGTKILKGRNLEEGQFTFALNKVAEDGTFLEKLQEAKNNKDGAIKFNDVIYTQEDIGKIYYYQLLEINDKKPGYTYDNSIYNIKVEVIDNNDGTLRIVKDVTKNSEEAKEITFTNSYKASGKTQITATKSLTGKALANNQFSFAMQQIDSLSGAEVGEKIVVRNDDKGTIVFPEIEYTEVDAGKDFYYNVYEINEGMSGYSYDSTVYNVKVTVIDNGDDTLKTQQEVASPKYKTDIKFQNMYIVSNVSLSLEGTKILKGRNLEEGQFTFALNKVTEDGTFLEKFQEAKNNRDGAIKFNDVIYTQEDIGKTYYYQLLEINDKKPGYTYDSSIYNIKVEVVDNNDGTLKIAYDTTKSADGSLNSKINRVKFSNTYTAQGSTKLSAKKVLEGMKLSDKMFEFKLMDEKGENTLQTAHNDEGGNILFDSIFFTENQLGTHKYIIREVNDNKEGITYDKADYVVSINVTDNGDGTLKTKTSIVKKVGLEESKVDTIQFINQCKLLIDTDVPNTGDNSNILLYIGAILISMVSLFLMYQKRTRN